MRLISISAAFLLCFASALPAQEGDKVTLEWKFKKGDTLRYEMSQVQQMEFSGNEMVNDMLFGMSMEVSDVSAEGVGTLKVTYDRIKVKVAAGPMNSDFDSDKDKKAPEGDMMGRMFAAIVGKSVTLQLTRKGECVKFEGMAKVIADALKELPEEMQGMAEMMKGSFTDDVGKSWMQMGFGFLPKAPVAKGENWSDSASLSLGLMGKMDMKTKSTLKEVRNGGKEAVVGQDTKFEFKAGEGGAMGPMEVTDSKMKTEMIWLVDRGAMQSAKGTMTMDMTAGGQEMTITTKIDVKLAPKSKDTPSVDPKSPKDPKEGK